MKTYNIGNREISFRACNKRNKSFIEIDKLSFFGGYGIDDKYIDDDIVFLQFTGLKDKNGKEIYEGDIIKCGKYQKIICVFHAGIFGFALAESKGFAYNNSLYHLLVLGVKLEIIGNIFKNPELLK